ncbi:serine/arginine repetitive matrix protein 2-like [Gopherus flavomarginatus]|uniref:serine/arginine repetitive matrix protein 2-like n=1 Tax=Gopherus flavomarginatus TaxID=286002 RepID=UPI0021CC4AEF|nr:serine/arginine repetitive matrix protein 2-like [Gopherus flavomarginatus]
MVEFVVPSTPETFSTARDLIALMEPELPRPPAPPVRVPQSAGKPALVRPPSPGTMGLRHCRSRSRSRRRSRSRHQSRSCGRSQSQYHSPARYQSYSRYRSRSRSPSRHNRHRSRSCQHSRHRASRSRSRHYGSWHRSTSWHRAGRRSWSQSRHRQGSRHRSPAPRRDGSSGRRDHHFPVSAPPWPSHQPSVSSQARSASYGDSDNQQDPHQWSFWTPWAYHQSQGAPHPPLRSGPSEHRAPEATVSRPPPAGTEHLPAQVSDVQDPPQDVPQDQESLQDPLVPEVSSSSSPDEAVAGTATAGPPSIDLRSYQDLLRWVALNINLPVEEVPELEDPVVTILSAEAPTRVALPFIRTIQARADTIWQTPASVPPTAKGVERKYMFHPRGTSTYTYTLPLVR